MKYKKGFAPVLIIVIVIALALIGGGAYYFGKSSNTIPVVENNLPQENQNDVVNNPVTNTSVTTSTTTTTTTTNDCLPTTAPWIKVLSPNGGENYVPSQQIAVTWKSCNFVPSNSAGGLDIKISLIWEENSESDSFLLTHNGTPNDGKEVVKLPNLTELNSFYIHNTYKIAVSRNDPSALLPYLGGKSDNTFIINSTTTPTASWKTYINTGCGYSFQYPNSWSQLSDESNAINLQGSIMSRIVDFIDTASQGIELFDGSNNQIAAAKDRMHVECYTMGTDIYNDELSRYNDSSDIFAQNKKIITVAGQVAIVGEMKNTATVSGGAHPGRTVIPSHNIYVFFLHKDQTRALYFEFDTPLGNGDAVEIANFYQLLTTFKFKN